MDNIWIKQESMENTGTDEAPHLGCHGNTGGSDVGTNKMRPCGLLNTSHLVSSEVDDVTALREEYTLDDTTVVGDFSRDRSISLEIPEKNVYPLDKISAQPLPVIIKAESVEKTAFDKKEDEFNASSGDSGSKADFRVVAGCETDNALLSKTQTFVKSKENEDINEQLVVKGEPLEFENVINDVNFHRTCGSSDDHVRVNSWQTDSSNASAFDSSSLNEGETFGDRNWVVRDVVKKERLVYPEGEEVVEFTLKIERSHSPASDVTPSGTPDIREYTLAEDVPKNQTGYQRGFAEIETHDNSMKAEPMDYHPTKFEERFSSYPVSSQKSYLDLANPKETSVEYLDTPRESAKSGQKTCKQGIQTSNRRHETSKRRPDTSTKCLGKSKIHVPKMPSNVKKRTIRKTCDVCDRVFSSLKRLENHKLRHHSTDQSLTVNKPYVGVGPKRSKGQPTEVPQSKEIKAPRKHVCDICHQEFVSNYKLERHSSVHTLERPFKCGVCGKKFTSKEGLKTHSHVHADVKPFTCEVCGKGFVSAKVLRLHGVTHTGEQPFKCDICQKQFSRKGNLARHMETHSDVKSHKCDVCTTAFFSKSALDIHVASYHGEKRFKCTECGRKFGFKGRLTAHILKHNLQYLCSHCGKRFQTKSHLQSHLATHTMDSNWKSQNPC